MIKSILESIGMNNTQIFYHRFNLKLNLEKSLLCKWKILHSTIESSFRVLSDEIVEMLFKKTIDDCNGNTKCVYMLIKLMEKKCYWASYNIDNAKGTFGLRGSSRSESNYSSVRFFVSQNLEGIHGAMQQLMSRQHKLMLQNNEIIFLNNI